MGPSWQETVNQPALPAEPASTFYQGSFRVRITVEREFEPSRTKRQPESALH